MSQEASIWGDTQVGDVISVKGPSVPPVLWDKFFRVVAIDSDTHEMRLSPPYRDLACTEPFTRRSRRG